MQQQMQQQQQQQMQAGMPRMVAVPSGGGQPGMPNTAMMAAQGQAGMGQNVQQQGRM
jgi:hypothetical protein